MFLQSPKITIKKNRLQMVEDISNNFFSEVKYMIIYFELKYISYISLEVISTIGYITNS